MKNSPQQIVFVLNNRRLSGRLTRFFTGCYCYHVGIRIGDKFYDMKWRRRVRDWKPSYYPNDRYIVFNSPVKINEKFLIEKMIGTDAHYGFKDYLLFALKPLFKLFKIPLKNQDGMICSEQVNNDLIDMGWNSPWSKTEHPPSPCEMLRYFKSKKPTSSYYL